MLLDIALASVLREVVIRISFYLLQCMNRDIKLPKICILFTEKIVHGEIIIYDQLLFMINFFTYLVT